MQATYLSDLRKGQTARVIDVRDQHQDDPIARRLRELGFIPGQLVRLGSTGPIARDPLLIQVGNARFALRRAEAERIQVAVPEVEPAA